MHVIYRVDHLLLGWVDFDLWCSTILPQAPSCSASSANFPSAQAEPGRGLNSQNQSQPNLAQLSEQMAPCICGPLRLLSGSTQSQNMKLSSAMSPSHWTPLFMFQEVDHNVDDEMVKAFIKMEIKFKFRDKISWYLGKSETCLYPSAAPVFDSLQTCSCCSRSSGLLYKKVRFETDHRIIRLLGMIRFTFAWNRLFLGNGPNYGPFINGSFYTTDPWFQTYSK